MAKPLLDRAVTLCCYGTLMNPQYGQLETEGQLALLSACKVHACAEQLRASNWLG